MTIFSPILAFITVNGLSVADLMVCFGASFALCLAVVLARPLYLHHTARPDDITAVQAAHRRPTPRIGGVAVVAVVCVMALVSGAGPITWGLVISLAPVFLGGLAEDVGIGAGPRARLSMAVLSGLLAVGILGVWVDRIDLPGVDLLLAFWPLGIAFTLLCSAGFSHAYNLIDGLNGLAGGLGIVIALGLAAIASLVGNGEVARLSLLLAAALLGFLVFNWPMGTIFLGDAGAYSLGHLFAWLAIVLSAESPAPAAFALALVLFWPVADTIVAIVRRRLRGQSPFLPDRMHFHQLVMRALELSGVGRAKRHITNPLAGMIVLPFAAAPVGVGIATWASPVAASILFGALFVIYVVSYRTLVDFARQRRQVLRLEVFLRRATRGRSDLVDGVPDYLNSRLSGPVVEGGYALDLQIYRRESELGWRMQAINSAGDVVRWREAFPSDDAAWTAFRRTLSRVGVSNLAGRTDLQSV